MDSLFNISTPNLGKQHIYFWKVENVRGNREYLKKYLIKKTFAGLTLCLGRGAVSGGRTRRGGP